MVDDAVSERPQLNVTKTLIKKGKVNEESAGIL